MLLIADVHAVPRGTDKSNELEKRGYNCWIGKELLRRAIEDAKLRGGFDAIAFLGDMVVDGDSPWAGQCFRELLAETRAAAPETPLLVVPGNHDRDPRTLLETFGDRPGRHEMGGGTVS